MPKYPTSILALLVSLAILSVAPARAAGEILITQAKAIAGNVTPGDAAGFPVTLSRPGAYQLASNLQPPAGKTAIRITHDRVTIDLNGFQLNGAGVATIGINGADLNGATVRNGTIIDFAAHGIYGTGRNWIVEDVRVVENGSRGIYVGDFSAVRHSRVTQNEITGIYCPGHCLVEDSTVSGNGGVGILIGAGTVLGNVIINNEGFGINGGTWTGFGNNTLAFNNAGGDQVNAAPSPLHPNACTVCP